jgi:hypothetical protein
VKKNMGNTPSGQELLNALELLIQAGRASDSKGNFELAGKYFGEPPNSLNGRHALFELGIFDGRPIYRSDNPCNDLYDYQLKGKLSSHGVHMYSIMIASFTNELGPSDHPRVG